MTISASVSMATSSEVNTFKRRRTSQRFAFLVSGLITCTFSHWSLQAGPQCESVGQWSVPSDGLGISADIRWDRQHHLVPSGADLRVTTVPSPQVEPRRESGNSAALFKSLTPDPHSARATAGST